MNLIRITTIIFNFFSSEELRNANIKKNSTPDPWELGLNIDAYMSCDGFTYNVTRMAGPPTPEDLKIRSASQWAILSREFVEDLVNQVNIIRVFN